MTGAERNRQAAIFIWSSLIIATVLLLSRRVAGGIDAISSHWPCLIVSLLATCLSGFGWVSFQRQSGHGSIRGEQFAAVVAWLPGWLAGIALLPSDSPLGRGWLFGIAALSAAGIAFTYRHSGQELTAMNNTLSSSRRVTDTAPSFIVATETQPTRPMDVENRPTSALPSDLSVFDPVNDERINDSTTQWMTRQTLPDGVEQIEGTIRVAFAAGQRAVSIHVPFSPPFASVPQVACETIGDEPTRWKVSVVYAYGMRIDVKREASDQPLEIELSYSAICESTSSEAA